MVLAKPFFIRPMGNGLLKPKVGIPGSEIAGQVEAVGKNIKQFQPGDEVFSGMPHGSFGTNIKKKRLPF
jgi:NADPH:quinone reductase-like Zn-dependent oxidoreductase